MPAEAEAPIAAERLWLLRALTVLVAPGAVFAGLRDDSDPAARARSEAVLALVLLSGIALVLWTPTYGRLMDDPVYDGLLVAVVAFIGGGIYAAATYFVAGLVVYGLARVVGGGSYRQARHLVAFASAPLALSLFLVWPLRLAIYGADSFRTGGSDEGAGVLAFEGLSAAFGLWSFALLVLGVSVIERWTLVRALVAV